MVRAFRKARIFGVKLRWTSLHRIKWGFLLSHHQLLCYFGMDTKCSLHITHPSDLCSCGFAVVHGVKVFFSCGKGHRDQKWSKEPEGLQYSDGLVSASLVVGGGCGVGGGQKLLGTLFISGVRGDRGPAHVCGHAECVLLSVSASIPLSVRPSFLPVYTGMLIHSVLRSLLIVTKYQVSSWQTCCKYFYLFLTFFPQACKQFLVCCTRTIPFIH